MRRALALIAAMALLGEPAMARDEENANGARRIMRAYGLCLVKSKRRMVLDALAKSPERGDGAIASLSTPDCLDGLSPNEGSYVSMLRFQPTLLRGELYRALFLRGAAPTAPYWRAEAGNPSFVLRSFGDCVVARDEVGATAAIKTMVASDGEDAAYARLAPAMGACVDPASRLRFSRTVLEGVLSEALFYRSVTTTDTISRKAS